MNELKPGFPYEYRVIIRGTKRHILLHMFQLVLVAILFPILVLGTYMENKGYINKDD